MHLYFVENSLKIWKILMEIYTHPTYNMQQVYYV